MKRQPDQNPRAFTLIELLVVVAIIAVLIGILLPALSAARRHGQSVKCATNLHHVSQAMGGYLADSNGIYPPAYVYPYDFEGNYDLNDQLSVDNAPFGYLHWSYYLYAGKNTPQESFQCPSIPNGGLPRTNPGPEGWEPGQVDGSGNSGPPSGVEDKQATRLAYTGNAAIFPRNKFQLGMSTGGGARANICVNEKSIDDPARVVLATEFNQNWKLVAQGGGDSGLLSKSHRPINVLQALSSPSEYDVDPSPPNGFTYGQASTNFGLQGENVVATARDLLAGGGYSQANAVGRHHPGGDKLGGTANFLYADGHVERKTIRQTLESWEWGRRYYSLTGYNKVGPPWN